MKFLLYKSQLLGGFRMFQSTNFESEKLSQIASLVVFGPVTWLCFLKTNIILDSINVFTVIIFID